jgi:hypothetical protein
MIIPAANIMPSSASLKQFFDRHLELLTPSKKKPLRIIREGPIP